MTTSARLYNVYLDRPRSTAPGAAAALAQAMAAHYGLPAAEIERRLATGRFRVKTGVDRATADAFAGDLAQLGAEVSVGGGGADATGPGGDRAPSGAAVAAAAAGAGGGGAPADRGAGDPTARARERWRPRRAVGDAPADRGVGDPTARACDRRRRRW
ncbi:MAG: hypothetical protein HS111_37195 [Kofleriaceae bacterium]|nr:hypothetical protein [Kofleriaceae bacterium]